MYSVIKLTLIKSPSVYTSRMFNSSSAVLRLCTAVRQQCVMFVVDVQINSDRKMNDHGRFIGQDLVPGCWQCRYMLLESMH